MPHRTRGSNYWKFSLNKIRIGLVSSQVCYEALPLITNMVVHVIYFGGNSALRYHKNIVNECTLTGTNKHILGLQGLLIHIHIAREILCIRPLV